MLNKHNVCLPFKYDDDDDHDHEDVYDDDKDDDVGQPSRVLLYALAGWVERFNLSWVVLLNTFPGIISKVMVEPLVLTDDLWIS